MEVKKIELKKKERKKAKLEKKKRKEERWNKLKMKMKKGNKRQGGKFEASWHDRINMTENWLEYDRKITTLFVLKYLIYLKLNMTKNVLFLWQKQTVTLPKKHAGAVGLDRSPSPDSQACTGQDTCPAWLAPLLCSSTRKKISGMEFRRTPDVMLRFVSFNFGHIQ